MILTSNPEHRWVLPDDSDLAALRDDLSEAIGIADAGMGAAVTRVDVVILGAPSELFVVNAKIEGFALVDTDDAPDVEIDADVLR
ncbi:MAG TPA: hypothetical protein VFH70_08950 [Acidimicrobiales bacterium]|nr:hypothetical protein [Acidimicrobiales bacterium]